MYIVKCSKRSEMYSLWVCLCTGLLCVHQIVWGNSYRKYFVVLTFPTANYVDCGGKVHLEIKGDFFGTCENNRQWNPSIVGPFIVDPSINRTLFAVPNSPKIRTYTSLIRTPH